MSHPTSRLPRLRTGEGPGARVHDGVTLVVYAPFGTDAALSHYPDGQSRSLAQHPLLRALLQVAEQGLHVVALVDRVGEDTELVEIDGGQPASLRVSSRWKQDMGSPQTLAGLLTHFATADEGDTTFLDEQLEPALEDIAEDLKAWVRGAREVSSGG